MNNTEEKSTNTNTNNTNKLIQNTYNNQNNT